MTTIPQIAAELQDLLTTVARRVGCATGFVQRRSKIDGAAFCQMLVFGWLANANATLAELTATGASLGITLSPQGLDERFTAPAAACLAGVLTEAITRLISVEAPVVPLLARFNGVYIQDSTTIALPDALSTEWAGCGNASGTGLAALKVQVQYDYRRGTLQQFVLQAGRAQDRTAPLQQGILPVGSLRLADLGYFSLPAMAAWSAHASYWLLRLQAHTCVYQPAGQRLDLRTYLAQTSAAEVDLAVLLGEEQRLPCRLLALRVPSAVAAQRRRDLHAEARHKGQKVSQWRLDLVDWTLLVTNVPATHLTGAEAQVLASCRWQIELLFKLWKSHGQVDTSRSTQPWRILCEVYAKLLAMIIQHWLLLISCWQIPDRSLTRAAQTIRGLALHLAAHFHTLADLIAALAHLCQVLAAAPRLNKRRKTPSTYQRLLATDS